MTVLLFVATILTFLGIDYLVRRLKGEPSTSSVPARASVVPALRFPGGIFFSKTHTWVNLFPSGTLQLGMDDFAVRMFAHPELTLLKAEGQMVAKGEPIIRVQDGANAFSLHSPVEGRITGLNAGLTTIASSKGGTFANNWAYTIEPKGGASQVRNLFLGAETRTWIKSEMGRLRDFLATTAAGAGETPALMMQDGGEPLPGILNSLTPEACARFEQQFLLND
jgi:glycine cleavage system H protein